MADHPKNPREPLDLTMIGRLMLNRDLMSEGGFSMNIGEAAKTAGVNTKFIRHYETRGIIPKALRTESGYRVYSDTDVHILIFVKHARNLGFSLPEIKKLVSLWRNKNRKSEDVKSITAKHIEALNSKIRELESIKRALETLAHHCHGDDRPDCPILENFAETKKT
jgi:MerR family gold-responsive transcriptional activator of gol and ges genes